MGPRSELAEEEDANDEDALCEYVCENELESIAIVSAVRSSVGDGEVSLAGRGMSNEAGAAHGECCFIWLRVTPKLRELGAGRKVRMFDDATDGDGGRRSVLSNCISVVIVGTFKTFFSPTTGRLMDCIDALASLFPMEVPFLAYGFEGGARAVLCTVSITATLDCLLRLGLRVGGLRIPTGDPCRARSLDSSSAFALCARDNEGGSLKPS